MRQWRGIGLLVAVTALGAAAILPAMAAVPTGFLAADIGSPDTPGSVVDNGGGKWTIKGSGNAFNGNTEDQLYFVYKSVKGDGSVRFKELAQAPEGNQYVGAMVRASIDANAAMAGGISSTSAVNWIYRTAADETAVRVDGNKPLFTFPKWMMAQRVGNVVSAFESSDGRLWTQVGTPLELPLEDTAVIGVAVSSRASDPITVQAEGVDVSEGVVTVTGVQSAATNNMALITWLPVAKAVGYNIYRGAADAATIDKTTLLNATGPQVDPFYFDNAASDKPLRELSYAVAPVFTGTDGKPVEGPAVRVR